MFSKPILIFAVAMATTEASAQSEASVSHSTSGISEATGALIGGAIGAGSALTVGTVAVTESSAYLTVISAATSASEAADVTLEIPLALAALPSRHDIHPLHPANFRWFHAC